MKQGNAPGMLNARRYRALNRLEEQLSSGVKNQGGALVPLTESDIKRIEKEKAVLNSRLVTETVALTTKCKKYRGPR